MNRCYRLVWNRNTERWVVAHERARSRGKRAGVLRTVSVAVAAALAGFAASAQALPTGGQVSAGTGTIAQSGTDMTVSQSTSKLSLNWRSFGIGAGESVTFRQPDSSAIALNRVLGTDPSRIYGRLSANGQVFLLNPNGLLFGPGAQVNVGGLVASTLNLSDSDFMAGRYSFAGSGGSVVNQGAISAADGGYVALLGAQVSNQGTIEARLGTVALAAGRKVTLDLAGDSLVSLQVDEGVVDALAQNKQLIRTDGGTALLTAKAAGTLEAAVVNNSGVVEAQTIESHGGVIRLVGDAQNGVAQVGGTLDASAPNGGDGGQVETSAAKVQVTDDAVVTTAAPAGHAGTWLIDPQDFTVGASGDITGATLSGNLASGNVTISSSDGSATGAGDINVNDAVSWNASTVLTLNASNDINVNAGITAFGAASGLNLNANTANGADAASGTGSVNIVNNTVNVAGTVNVTGVDLSIGSAGESAPSQLLTGDLNASLSGNLNLAAGSGSGISAIIRSSGAQSVSAHGNLTLSAGEGTDSSAMLQVTGGGAQQVTVDGAIVATAGGNSSNGSNNRAYILKGGGGTQTVSAYSVQLTGGGGSSGDSNKAAILTAPNSGASQLVNIGAGGLSVLAGSGSGAGNTAGIWVLDDYPPANNTATSATQLVSVLGNVAITGGSNGATAGNNNASIFQSSTGAGASQTVSVAGSIALTGGASGMSGGAFISSNAPSQTVSAGGIAIHGGGGTDGINNGAGIFQNNPLGAQSITVNGAGSINITGGSGSSGWNTAQIYSVGSGGQTIDFTPGGAINLTGGTGVIDSTAGASNYAKIETTSGNQTITGLPSITIQGGTDGGSSGGSTNLGNYALIRADSGTQYIDAAAISLAAGSSGIDSSATIQGPTQVINASSVSLSGGGASGTFSGARIGGHGGSGGGPTNLALTTSGPVTIMGGAHSGAAIGANPVGGWPTDITINSGGDVTLQPGTGAGVRIGSTAGGPTVGNIVIIAQGNITLGENGGIGSGIYTAGDVSLDVTAGPAGKSILEQPASVIVANSLTTVSDAGTLLQGTNRVGSFNATNFGSGDVFFQDAMAAFDVTGVRNNAYGGDVYVNGFGDVGVTGDVTAANGGDLTLAATGNLSIGNPASGIFVTDGTDWTNTGNMTLSGANVSILGGNGSDNTFVGLSGSGTQQVTAAANLTMTATASPNGAAYLSANDMATQSISVGGNLVLSGGEGTYNQAVILQNGAGAQSISAGSVTLSGGEGGNSSALIMQNGSGDQTVAVESSIVAIAGGDSYGGGNNAYITDNGAGVQSVSANSIVLAGGGGASGVGNTAGIAQYNLSGTQNVTVNGGGSISITGGSGSGGANFAQIYSRGSGPQTIAFTSGGSIDLTGGVGVPVSGAPTSNFARIEATSGDQSIMGGPSISIQGGSDGSDYVGTTNLGNFAFIRADSGLQRIDAGTITLTAGASGINNSASIQGPTQVINASSVALIGGGGSGGYAGARIGGRGGLAGGPTNLTLTTSGPVTLTGGSTTGVAIGANPSGGGPTEITIDAGGNVTLMPGTATGVRIGSPAGMVDGGNISIFSHGNIVLGENGGIGSGIYTSGDVTLNVTTGPAGKSIFEAPASEIVANSLTTSSDTGTLLLGTNQIGSFNATNYGSGDVVLKDAMPVLQVTNVWNNGFGGSVGITNSGGIDVTGNVFTADNGDLTLAAGDDLLIGNPATGISVFAGSSPLNTGNMSLSGANIGIVGGNNSLMTNVGLSGSGTQSVTTPGDFTIAGTASPGGAALLNANDSVTQQVEVDGTLALTGGDGAGNFANIFANGGAQSIVAGSITLSGGEGSFSQAIIGQFGAGAQTVSAGSITLSGGEGANSSAMIMQNGAGAQTVAAGGSIVATAGGNSYGGGNNAYIVDNGAGVQSVSANSIALTGGGGASGVGNIAGIAQYNFSGTQSVTVNGGGSISITGGSGTGGANLAQIFSQSGAPQTIAFTGGGAINLTGGTGAPVSTAPASNFARIEATSGGQSITGGPSISIRGGSDGTDYVGTKNLGNFAFIRADSGLQSIDAGTITLTAGASGINNSASIQGPTQVINASSVALNGGGGSGGYAGARIGGRGGLAGGPTNLMLTTTGQVTLTGGSTTGVAIGANPSGGGPTEITIISGGNVTLTPGAVAGVRIGSPSSLLDGGNISVTSQGDITLGENAGIGSGIYTTGDVSLTANAFGGSILEQPASAIVANSLMTLSDAGTLLDGANQVAAFNGTNVTSGNVSLVNTADPLTITGITNNGGDISVDNTGAIVTTGLISAPSGSISIVSHSPLTIGSPGVTAGGGVTLSAGQTADPGDVLELDGPIGSTGGGDIVLYAGDDLLQNSDVSSNGGSVSATSADGSITMAAGTTTSSGGGGISYAAPSGDINLSSLDAGTGAIDLSAGGNIQPTSGYTGVNLTGDSATVEAGGDVTLTTQLKRWTKVSAGGTVSITKLHPCRDDDGCNEDEDDQGGDD